MGRISGRRAVEELRAEVTRRRSRLLPWRRAESVGGPPVVARGRAASLGGVLLRLGEEVCIMCKI